MITQKRLIELLRELPEVKLELIPLVWKLTDEEGNPDLQKIAFHYNELEKAISQAEDYARGTREMVACLISLVR